MFNFKYPDKPRCQYLSRCCLDLQDASNVVYISGQMLADHTGTRPSDGSVYADTEVQNRSLEQIRPDCAEEKIQIKMPSWTPPLGGPHRALPTGHCQVGSSVGH